MKERYTDINEYVRDLQEEIQKDPKCAIHHYNLGGWRTSGLSGSLPEGRERIR